MSINDTSCYTNSHLYKHMLLIIQLILQILNFLNKSMAYHSLQNEGRNGYIT